RAPEEGRRHQGQSCAPPSHHRDILPWPTCPGKEPAEPPAWTQKHRNLFTPGGGYSSMKLCLRTSVFPLSMSTVQVLLFLPFTRRTVWVPGASGTRLGT